MKTYIARIVSVVAGVCVIVALCGLPVFAQDPNLPPTYGTVSLTAGFMPDPYGARVVAGGPIYTSLGGVNAYVARAPDFRVYYTAGSYPLTFFVTASADTTLLINLPDGSWVADDDSGGSLNPMIRLLSPPSGRYDIWVGTFQPGYPPANLYVTER